MENLVSVLRNEEKELIKKIVKARENDNEGTYKNLIRSLADVSRLRRDEEYFLRPNMAGDFKQSIVADKCTGVLSHNSDDGNIHLSVVSVKESGISCFTDEINYKEKLMKSEKKIVFCNWKRGYGKTSAALEKTFKNNKRCLYVSPCVNEFNHLPDNYNTLSVDAYLLGAFRGEKYEYIIFDEYIPSSRELKEVLPCVEKQILVMFTGSDIEYIEN